MSSKGHIGDSAVVEHFFGSLQQERGPVGKLLNTI